MSEFVRESSHHGILCEIANAANIHKARIDVNIDGVLVRFELALRAFEVAVCCHFGLI